ncbi:MAG: ECF transporter S component [Thaumarchaeota archaeon]|nr:ECF transporter S component [Nitrososphaerota archaeon]
MNSQTLASAAIFTAFVAAATSVFTIYIPATTGYFNVGEIMVYTCALLMGPYVGAFAGGVGSMISDLSLGAPYFAPGTLVIKGIEGFIVGYLGTRTFPKVTRSGWRGITLGFGLVFCLALAYIGSEFLSGDFMITLGGAWNIPSYAFDLQVPLLFWPVLGTVAFVIIAFVATRIEVKSGQSVMSVLVGGSEMVAGYYLYESLILTLIAPASVVATLAPAAEVPFNVAQALIGLLVAVPLVRSIKRITRGRGLWAPTTDVSSGSRKQ